MLQHLEAQCGCAIPVVNVQSNLDCFVIFLLRFKSELDADAGIYFGLMFKNRNKDLVN